MSRVFGGETGQVGDCHRVVTQMGASVVSSFPTAAGERSIHTLCVCVCLLRLGGKPKVRNRHL